MYHHFLRRLPLWVVQTLGLNAGCTTDVARRDLCNEVEVVEGSNWM